jgi:hypothetical protein
MSHTTGGFFYLNLQVLVLLYFEIDLKHYLLTPCSCVSAFQAPP